MTERELHGLLLRHNLLHTVLAGVAGIGSLVMWPVLFRVVQYMLTDRNRSAIEPDTAFSWYGAWVVVTLVAVIGFWKVRQRFMSDDFSQSEVAESLRSSGSWSGSQLYGGAAVLYFLLSMLFFPPALLLKAIEFYRQIIRVPQAMVAEAAALLGQLEANRRWIPVSQLKEHRAGLYLLERLDLILTELRNDETQVRIVPKDTLPAVDDEAR